MLPQLEALLRASPKVVSVQIVDHDFLDEENFLLKLRCELVSGRLLQIRLRMVGRALRYSYQEFAHLPLQRWDNAPHFSHLSTFPHHHHTSQ
jgi:hypothetical protein